MPSKSKNKLTPSVVGDKQGPSVALPSVDYKEVTLEIANRYRVGTSIPDLLRAILTELVWARLEGR